MGSIDDGDRAAGTSSVLLAICIALLLADWGVLVFLAPRAMEVFKDFDVALPAATTMLLNASIRLSGLPSLMLVSGAIAAVVAWTVVVKSASGRRAGLAAIAAVAAIWLLVTVAVLLVPMYRLATSVSGVR